jgi:hypothetical protein
VDGFQAALEVFPNASAVMIEISQLSFTNDDLDNAMDQARYSRKFGKALAQLLGAPRQIRNIS